MQTTPFERVMQTYAMIVNLTSEQEKQTREELAQFLQTCTGSDNELAVQGLQFLRGDRPYNRRSTYIK